MKAFRSQGGDESTLSARYPSIDNISISLTYHSPEGFLLDEETRKISSGDIFDFSANCPGRCGGGKMALEDKVADMVRNRQTRSAPRAKCAMPIFADAAELCGCELQCEIEIRYQPSAE